MPPRFFDIHAHVHDKSFDGDREEVLARMETTNTGAIMVGTDYEDSKRAVDIARSRERGIYATIGIHPIDNKKAQWDERRFKELIDSGKVVAIGECGLDYSRLDDVPDVSEEKKRQKFLFEAQIDFALEHDLPLMIHCRDSDKVHADAHRDLLAILREKKDYGEGRLRGNVHFFSQTLAIANEYVGLGFTVSFTGVITFTHEYDEVVRELPLECMMTETDCPYVAPIPFRGKRNEPSFVSYTAEHIALLRGEDPELVRQKLLETTFRAWGIKNI